MAEKLMKKQAFANGRRVNGKSYAVDGTSAIKQAEEEMLDWEGDYEVLKALWSVSAGQSFSGKIKTTIKSLYRSFMVEFFALDILEQL